MTSFPLDTSKYELLHLIGTGTYSRVYEARCIPNQKIIAIKQINLEQFPLELETIQRQTAFWSKCSHPNIVEYYGSFVDGSTLWILNEFMAAGSLKDLIKYKYPSGFGDEALISALLAQVVSGVKFFHDNHEIHRDIRSNNILVNSEGVAKLGDFGLATSLVKGGTRQGSTLSLFGEECYMAPEVLRNENGYSEKTDIWSLGLTAIEFGTGKMPYAGMKFMESLVQIIDNEPPTLPDTKQFSAAYKDFVKACLNAIPSKRATAAELLNHRFLKPYAATLPTNANSTTSTPNLLNTFQPSACQAAVYTKKTMLEDLIPLHKMFDILHGAAKTESLMQSKEPPVPQMVFEFPTIDEEMHGNQNIIEKKKKKKGKKKAHRSKHVHSYSSSSDSSSSSNDDNNDKHQIEPSIPRSSSYQTDTKADVKQMGRFSVTRTEGPALHQALTAQSSSPITRNVQSLQQDESAKVITAAGQTPQEQQSRIKQLENDLRSFTEELVRLENENKELKSELAELTNIVSKITNKH